MSHTPSHVSRGSDSIQYRESCNWAYDYLIKYNIIQMGTRNWIEIKLQLSINLNKIKVWSLYIQNRLLIKYFMKKSCNILTESCNNCFIWRVWHLIRMMQTHLNGSDLSSMKMTRQLSVSGNGAWHVSVSKKGFSKTRGVSRDFRPIF